MRSSLCWTCSFTTKILFGKLGSTAFWSSNSLEDGMTVLRGIILKEPEPREGCNRVSGHAFHWNEQHCHTPKPTIQHPSTAKEKSACVGPDKESLFVEGSGYQPKILMNIRIRSSTRPPLKVARGSHALLLAAMSVMHVSP